MVDWVSVLPLETLRQQGRALVRVGGREVALFWVEGIIHALEDACPHAGASLAFSTLEGHWVRCQAHGLRFDVRTGQMAGGKGLCARRFDVRERAGLVEVAFRLG
ncbi:MAG: Rieske (2Fe-2S) protein [Curvibacter sp.]|nr:MAG: Rieske (2Fe-2S) protein [Curvibacter sp.]